MEFTQNRHGHGTITRSFEIADGPVMAHPNSTTGKKLRVTHCSISFRLKGDAWVADGWSDFRISGVVLKKDGSDSKETWGGTVHYSWEKRAEYNWLRTLVAAVQPEGTPTFPMRVTAIENDDLDEEG